MRLLERSATNSRPCESMASRCGTLNSPGPDPFLPQVLSKLPSLANLTMRIGVAAMSVGDEDVAVGRDQHVGRRIEETGIIAGHARYAERHQHLAVGAE